MANSKHQSHSVTDKDLKDNPDLKDAGVKKGENIEIPVAKSKDVVPEEKLQTPAEAQKGSNVELKDGAIQMTEEAKQEDSDAARPPAVKPQIVYPGSSEPLQD